MFYIILRVLFFNVITMTSFYMIPVGIHCVANTAATIKYVLFIISPIVLIFYTKVRFCIYFRFYFGIFIVFLIRFLIMNKKVKSKNLE